MAWFKVDDGFHSSRKLLRIPKRARWAAAGVWAVAGSWSADQLTDGHVPDYMIVEWGCPPAAPESLVLAGLWERTTDGYLFYNWHEYQPSKQDVDAERAASRERMRDLRARRKGRKPLEQAEEGDVFGRTGPNGSENVRNPDPVPTRPDPVPIKEETPQAAPRKRGARIPEDFSVTDQMHSWAKEKAPGIDLGVETEKFVNFWTAKSGRDATKLDWAATWRNWILNARPARDGSVIRMDHSARARMKEADMLSRLQAAQNQDQPFLEIEG